MKKFIRCINCDESFHTFKNCPKPVTSHGLLAFRIPKNANSLRKVNNFTENTSTNLDLINNLEFLLVQRKDTIGYIDFLRGKIPKKMKREDTYKTLAEEMTQEEKDRIISLPYDTLWDDLWLNHKSKTYINEYYPSKKKFFQMDLLNYIKNTPTRWNDQEYGIPKGRRNNRETAVQCAIREFIEETGYTRNEFILDYNLTKLEEVFLGSNGVMYKHVYYLAHIITDRDPEIDLKNILQAGEVKKIAWMNFKECINSFREYDSTKRGIIYQARNILRSVFSGSE